MIMNKFLEKLKEHWEVEYLWQVAVIFLIFSISGMSVLYVRKLAFQWLGFDKYTPIWEEAVTWILVVVPSYQILFLFFGFIFGQFEFALRFERKNLEFIKRCLIKVKRILGTE